MNILMLSHLYPPNRIGGMEKIVESISKGLTQNGHNVSVITGNYRNLNTPLDKINRDGIDIYFTDFNTIQYPNPFITEHLYTNFKFVELAVQVIKNKKVDIIHCHDWFCGSAGILIKNLTGIPLISTIHYVKFYEQKGRETENGNFICYLQKYLIENSDMVSVYSKKMIQELYELWPLVKVMYFPIGLEADIPIYFNSDEYKRKHNNLVMIGRLAKEKNFHTIMQAAKILLDELQDLHIDVIGNGLLEDELKKMAKQYELDVTFHGFINNDNLIYSIIRESKLFILPSSYDSFGLTVLEALQCGVPVLISQDVGAIEISSIIKDNFTFKTNSIEDLSQKILFILKNDHQIQDKMNKIYRDIEEKYTPHISAQHLEKIYVHTIAQHKQTYELT